MSAIAKFEQQTHVLTVPSHINEKTPLVPVELSVERNLHDPDDLIVRFGALHAHLGDDDIFRLGMLCVAFADPAKFENYAAMSPEFVQNALSFRDKARELILQAEADDAEMP